MPRAREPAIPDLESADLTLQRSPQRPELDAPLVDARPWAIRQARRAYAHLPQRLHEQAVDLALAEVRASAPGQTGRRGLHAALGEALTVALRAVHADWCREQAQRRWGPAPGTEDERPGRAIAAFVEDGLAGLERAVLQLEIGAARDSATARAALRLGPREYRRHRERGLAKLQAAIAALVAARVCDDHLDAVMLAATGDRLAAGGLSGGPGRCRACAREADVIRGVLHERLAMAPWPFAIKPAGLLAAQLGVFKAFGGGNGASGALSAGAAKSAVALAATLAAGGSTVAVVDHEPARDGGSRSPALVSEPPVAQRGMAVRQSQTRRAQARRAPERMPAPRPAPRPDARPAPAEPPGRTSTDAATDLAPRAVERLEKSIAPLTDTIEDAVARVDLPVPVPAPVAVQPTLDDATDAADRLLRQP